MPCIFCGSRFHDYRSCTAQYHAQKSIKLSPLKQSFFGKTPNVFIGRHGYPHVRVGLLGAESYEKNDEPLTWSREGTAIPEIIRLRSQLVNSHFAMSVKGASGSSSDRFAMITKEVSLAKRPVDVEIGLVEKPRFRLSTDRDVTPHGPAVALAHANITENVPIDTRVDKATSATDLGAADAVTSLAHKGIDEHQLTKAFSMGNFGIPTERKLVPTRWSITAVDDIIGKQKIDEIKRYAPGDCVAHFGGHLGNYYLILFFDNVWEYELFEQYVPSNRKSDADVVVETDYEAYEGRKDYVHETAGGYYAARIGILESLCERKRQAAVLAIRIITEEYSAPLGVWVVREAVRKCLASPPLHFADRNLLLAYAQPMLKSRFGYDIAPLLQRSLLVKSLFGQRRLSEY
jgi:hypothetical protein